MNNKKKIGAFVLAPKIPESDEVALELKILSGINYIYWDYVLPTVAWLNCLLHYFTL